MAAEKDLELLDNYLAHKLGAEERSAFEQKLNTDPDLKSEFELQQQFINGIKKARMGELKTMLNNIPVPAAPTSGAAVGAKVAMWAVAVGVIGTGLYFYFDDEKQLSPASEIQTQQEPDQSVKSNLPEDKTQSESENSNEEAPVVSEEPSSSEQKPVQSPKAIKKNDPGADQSSQEPKLDVYDPTKETEENPSQSGNANNVISKERNAPSIAVEVDTENKKYNFHYQFKQGKLILYGPFEKNLYEIMEFFADDKRTLFLYYNDQYFLLKEETGNGSVKPLAAIQDQELLKKLKEYRH